MELKEATLSSRHVYDGRVIKLDLDEVLLSNGKKDIREVAYHSNGVCIMAIDANNMVYFVKQFRYPLQDDLMELPAGKVEEGEDPLNAAQRELKEETGIIASKWAFLGQKYVSPGFTNECVFLYLARGLTKTDPEPELNELIMPVTLNIKRAVDLVAKNDIKDCKSALTILLADKYIQNENLIK